ncbi:MAG: response regulator [Caulobacteraceae bacterium]|nr:response regulator [Caulobacteraceae bacterium]
MAGEARVHVIDDDESVRDSLAFLFESADLAVRTYDSASSFLEALGAVGPSCVVTDVRMPGMSGIDLLRGLKARGAGLPVIVITGHGDVPLAVEAMRDGAFDFLEKPFVDEQLLGSVRRALAQAAGGAGDGDRQAARARLSRLSGRERQVLTRLVAGQLNKTIAHELDISIRTVEVYRAKVMDKMEAASFADLVRMTVLAGEGDR